MPRLSNSTQREDSKPKRHYWSNRCAEPTWDRNEFTGGRQLPVVTVTDRDTFLNTSLPLPFHIESAQVNTNSNVSSHLATRPAPCALRPAPCALRPAPNPAERLRQPPCATPDTPPPLHFQPLRAPLPPASGCVWTCGPHGLRLGPGRAGPGQAPDHANLKRSISRIKP